MFCSDDKHPDSLVEGHINELCARAVAKGIDVFNVLQAACINPVEHYRLDVGLLKEGDAADFIVVKDLKTFEVAQTYIDGVLVAEGGKTLIDRTESEAAINNFDCSLSKVEDFFYEEALSALPVIEALDGQLITNKILLNRNENLRLPDTEKDILKIVVVNRYNDAPVAKAFIKNFGLKQGAIASSVAHDSHNIVAVGVDDESICKAVNLIIEHRGGVSCVGGPIPDPSRWVGPSNAQPLPNKETAINTDSSRSEASVMDGFPQREKSEGGREVSVEDSPPEGGGWEGAVILPLPVGGLMSADDGYKVAEQYATIDKAAKALGSTLSSPFMTLSFMALLVIPHLKLSDKGLFDGDGFRLVD
jgi:adenine deaminase